MSKLYALSINGRTLYFTGNIPLNYLNQIDQVSKKIIFDKEKLNYQEYLQNFITEIKKMYNVDLIPISIEYVFRK